MTLNIEPHFIDRSFSVPVGRQLYGLLSYELSHGDLPKGTKLPSVRRLARDLGISQATVAQVYRDLRDAGLLEMRHGSGAFTRLAIPRGKDSREASFRADIERLLARAEELAISPVSLAAMISGQAQMRRTRAGLDIIFACVFPGPGAAYVEALRPRLSPRDRVSLVTIEQLRNDDAARAACDAADIVLTFVHREAEVAAIVPDAPVLGLRFIPSDATREALARIDPRARVVAISQLQDYIAIMKPSVQRFAPHVSDICVRWSFAEDLDAVISGADVVIYASGADHVTRLAGVGATCFEYRHTPDPAAVEADLLPRLAELRAHRRGELRIIEGGARTA